MNCNQLISSMAMAAMLAAGSLYGFAKDETTCQCQANKPATQHEHCHGLWSVLHDDNAEVLTVDTTFRITPPHKWYVASDAVQSVGIDYIVDISNSNLLKSGFGIRIGNIVSANLYSPNGKSKFSLGVGAGLDTYNIQSNYTPVYTEDNALKFLPVADDNLNQNNYILNYYLDLPLMFSQRLGSDFYMSAGVAGVYNYYTMALNQYTRGNVETHNYISGLKQRPFSFQVRGEMVFWDWLGVYCHWTPTSLFNKAKGPEFKTLSIGVELTRF